MKKTILYKTDIEKQKDLTLFVNIIYNNFIELSDDKKLMHTPEKIEESLRKDNSVIILFTNDDDKVIGFLTANIMILDDRRKVLYISYIYVAEITRNNKLGSTLLQEAEKTAIFNKCNGIMLIFDTHKHNLTRFYENRGYMLDINLRRFERNDVFYKIL